MKEKGHQRNNYVPMCLESTISMLRGLEVITLLQDMKQSIENIEEVLEENHDILEGRLNNIWEQSSRIKKVLKSGEIKEYGRELIKISRLERQKVQPQNIRLIRGYEFFEQQKHGWRRCRAHGQSMTAGHIIDNLFGEAVDWAEKLEKIVQYIQDIENGFYSQTIKYMKEQTNQEVN